jgi:hypothetical protein
MTSIPHLVVSGPSEPALEGPVAVNTGPGILEMIDRVLDRELEAGA